MRRLHGVLLTRSPPQVPRMDAPFMSILARMRRLVPWCWRRPVPLLTDDAAHTHHLSFNAYVRSANRGSTVWPRQAAAREALLRQHAVEKLPHFTAFRHNHGHSCDVCEFTIVSFSRARVTPTYHTRRSSSGLFSISLCVLRAISVIRTTWSASAPFAE